MVFYGGYLAKRKWSGYRLAGNTLRPVGTEGVDSDETGFTQGVL
jgi:hypothetical protein